MGEGGEVEREHSTVYLEYSFGSSPCFVGERHNVELTMSIHLYLQK